jgi:hypothetical protein
MRVGRSIAVAVVGMLFMLFVALDLVLFGVIPVNSVIVSILPLLGLVLGLAFGLAAGDREAATEDTGPAAAADT